MTSPHTHTRGTHRGHPRVPSRICHTQSITLTTHGDRVERRRRRQWHARADGLGRGGAATAWAAAALSARARRLCAARARSGAQGSVAARGNAAARARSGAQGSVAARGNAAAVASRRAARARRGGQVIGRRVMGRRVTAPSDRRRRAGRRSAAADLEGVRSATVGVGGRPSCGEEGGRQVRVVRVALHRPVERHSSRDRAWATKSRWGRWEVGRDSFRAFKSGFARSATLGLPRKGYPAGKGATGAAKFTPRGTTYVFVNVVVAPRYVARVQPGSGGL